MAYAGAMSISAFAYDDDEDGMDWYQQPEMDTTASEAEVVETAVEEEVVAEEPVVAEHNSLHSVPATRHMTEEQLLQAKQVLIQAEEAAAEIIKAAEYEAQEILTTANINVRNADKKLSPLAVKNQEVAVELHGATIEEIANALMPETWRVLVDVKNQSIKERRFQYISTKPRDQALISLTKPLNLKYQYFFHLTDEEGEPSPLLVISES